MVHGRIYLIVNNTNLKKYVGQTRGTISNRWNEHKKIARYGKTYALSSAIRKYGDDGFTVLEIDSASSLDELNQLEIFYIQFYKTLSPHGYNLDSGGRYYLTHPDTKAKIGAANKGRPSARKGKTHTLEARLKMSAAQKGRPSWWKGKKRSDQTKAKLSALRKGKPGTPHTDEFKQQLSERNRGNKYSLGLHRSEEWREGQRQIAVARERRPNGTFKAAGEP